MSLPWESVPPEMENGLPHPCEHWFTMTILHIKSRNHNNHS